FAEASTSVIVPSVGPGVVLVHGSAPSRSPRHGPDGLPERPARARRVPASPKIRPAVGIRPGAMPNVTRAVGLSVDLRLSFAYSARARGRNGSDSIELARSARRVDDASPDPAATRDPGFPERVHPAARLCAKPRGNRAPL